jgi:hypothetical protein
MVGDGFATFGAARGAGFVKVRVMCPLPCGRAGTVDISDPVRFPDEVSAGTLRYRMRCTVCGGTLPKVVWFAGALPTGGRI